LPKFDCSRKYAAASPRGQAMSPITLTAPTSSLEKCCEAWLRSWTEDSLGFSLKEHQPTALVKPVPMPAPQGGLASLVDIGPYHNIVFFFDIWDLCRVDASCRELRKINHAVGSAWSARGEDDLQGIQVGDDGVYSDKVCIPDPKRRYLQFFREARKFSEPFAGRDIQWVQEADECAQLLCGMRTDKLQDVGLYIELEVFANCDLLTLSVTDWDVGGCSSLSFSPDAGMVFIESAPFCLPKQVVGKYVNALPALDQKVPFHGELGIFVFAGRIAFFRRCRNAKVEALKDGNAEACKAEEGQWETSGYIAGLSWAQGSLLTPCIAFRNAGAYGVRIAKVCPKPPLPHEAIQAVTTAAVSSGSPRWRNIKLDDNA